MRKKITIAAAVFLSLLLGLGAFAVPAQAKTTKVYKIASEEHYYKTYDTEAWYLSNARKQTFDKKGNSTSDKFMSYDEKGSETSSFESKAKYNKKGNITLSEHYQDGKLESQTKYSYKKNTTTTKYYNGQKKLTGKSVYKSGKNKSESLEYNAKGKLVEKAVTTYTKKKTTTKVYNKKGKLIGKTIVTRSKNKITTTSYDKKGKVISKSVETYKKGKIQKRTSEYTNDDGSIYKTVITYDKKGRELKNVNTTTKNKKVTDQYTSQYQYDGKYITETSISFWDGNENKRQEKYYLDKAGNRVMSWSKVFNDEGKVDYTETYKNEMYTDGAAKGCLKQSIGIADDRETSKSIYTYKVFKQ